MNNHEKNKNREAGNKLLNFEEKKKNYIYETWGVKVK
jgi:hypothetical protein